MGRARKWYGVKTLFRTEPRGRPLGKDAHYSRSVTLVEERVVVLKARDGEEAIRLAESEAKRYARELRHRNPYGQQVRTRYLGFCSAYELFDPPGEMMEVFSETEVVSRSVSDRAVARRIIGGTKESRRVYESRRNILQLVFAGTAPGVSPTRAEWAFIDGLFPSRKGRKRSG